MQLRVKTLRLFQVEKWHVRSLTAENTVKNVCVGVDGEEGP
jgi:hypothetical protein